MSECRSCAASILWCLGSNGKSMPVDIEPVPEGNVMIVPDWKTGELRATVLAKKKLEAARLAGAQLHLAHFVSCPQAGDWRRK